MKVDVTFIVILGIVLAPGAAHGQWRELPSTGSPQNHLPDRTTLAGQSGIGALLTAELLDNNSNAKQHKAVVKVQTDGVKMVDPSASASQPRLDEAHLQYRLDRGPAHNTTSKVWTFQNLSAGEHTIHIDLMASDNHPLSKERTLTVDIP